MSSTSTGALRWQPETLVNLQEGVGFLPFLMPGSPSLMAANMRAICAAFGVVQPHF